MAATPVAFTVTSGSGAPLPVTNGTCLFGISSSGTAATPTRVGSIKALTDTFGQGPLVDAAAIYLAVAKAPLYVCRVTQTSAGTISAIVKTGAGAGTGTIADNASSPVNKFSVILTIVTTGTTGTPFTYKYSTDGGNNYSAILQGGAALTLGTTGIALTAADGGGPTTGFIAGDVFTFTTEAPTYNTSNLTTAVTALINSQSIRVRRIHAVLTNGPSFHSTLITLAGTTAFNAYKYLRAIEESDDLGGGPESVTAWQAGVLSDFATQSNRTCVIAGWQSTQLQTQQDGIDQQRTVPIAWTVGARIAAVDVSEDPGKAPSIDGPLTLTVVDSTYPVRQDGRLYTSFEGMGFTYGQSYVGLDGLYCAGGFTRIANSADVYYRLARAQVIDLACETVYQALLAYLNTSVSANSDGTIAEQAAQAIEADLNKKLADVLVNVTPQRVSPPDDNVFAEVDRTNNIVTSEQLKVTISLIPRGFIGTVAVTIGYNLNT